MPNPYSFRVGLTLDQCISSVEMMYDNGPSKTKQKQNWG